MRETLSVVLLLVLLASGCSLGPKEDWAEAIHDAPEAVRRARTAKVRVVVALTVIETNIRQTPKALVDEFDGVVDFRRRRAKLVAHRRGNPEVIFDDLVLYLPRSRASIGREKQHWVRFDFEREPVVDVDDTDRRRAVGAAVISPALATELLEGVLTGSIERVEAKGDTTRYRARLSQDGAVREVDDEDRREGILRIFESLGVQDDVFEADVWLDDKELPRRIRFVLRQQKDRVNAFQMRVAWEFADYGTEAAVTSPPRRDTVERRRFRELVEEFVREEV